MIKIIVCTLLLDLGICSCSKLVQIPPPITSVTGADVYNSNATAAAVLTGLYTQLSNINYDYAVDIPSLSLWAGLSSDELTLWAGAANSVQSAYYTNALFASANVGFGNEFWSSAYPFIYTCNSAIEGLNNSTGLTPAVKNQLLGEAKFMRAFFYFYLTNLYGSLPLVISTDYKVNGALNRIAQPAIYQQIISDLTDAQGLLSSNYLDGTLLTVTNNRVRPTSWAAEALLARTYLYTQKWDSAESEASLIINNSTEFNLDTLNGVFLANSNEAIWQLQPVTTPVTNTPDAYLFVIPPTGPNTSIPNPVYLSMNLLNSFEVNDQRRVNWVDSVSVNGSTYYYPFKYKVSAVNAPVTEYIMMLRLGEQYLIRAEAKAEQGNIAGATGALSDLDTIRNRAGLPDYTGPADMVSVLTAIDHERQVELFTELGHRWLDLKRTGKVDSVMNIVTPQKGGTWSTYQQLFPVPSTDILEDPNLTQNPGY